MNPLPPRPILLVNGVFTRYTRLALVYGRMQDTDGRTIEMQIRVLLGAGGGGDVRVGGCYTTPDGQDVLAWGGAYTHQARRSPVIELVTLPGIAPPACEPFYTPGRGLRWLRIYPPRASRWIYIAEGTDWSVRRAPRPYLRTITPPQMGAFRWIPLS